MQRYKSLSVRFSCISLKSITVEGIPSFNRLRHELSKSKFPLTTYFKVNRNEKIN